MNTLAVTVRLATLALTAALSSTAFAQNAGPSEAGITLALNEAPLVKDWQPALVAAGERDQAQTVQRELAISVEEIAKKLDEQLEAKMARKLELAI